MKKTTYIIVGLLAASVLAFIIFLSLAVHSRQEWKAANPEEPDVFIYEDGVETEDTDTTITITIFPNVIEQ